MFTEAQQAELTRGALHWGVSLAAAQIAQFTQFADRLEEVNRHLNLTRIPPEAIGSLHFLDSLALAAVLTPQPGQRLIDVGTGGGFPGLPLAIAFPQLDVTLLDSTRKRLVFLDDVIAALGLTNVRTLHGRAEEIARFPAHRAAYDLVTARAVAKMPELARWMLPLCRPGGLCIAYKSRDADEEIRQSEPVIRKLGGRLEQIAEVVLPETEVVRKLAMLRKPLILSTRSARRSNI